MKSVTRRRIFQAIAVSTASKPGLKAQQATLSEDRRQAIQPVLDQRKAQLQALRSFDVDDSVAPTPGIQRHGCA